MFRTVEELSLYRRTVDEVGFVPTMGAFHRGHLELMRLSARTHPTTVVSIFVNPTQFNDPEDFRRYPRHEESDLDAASSAGVDAVFAPSAEEMYADRSASVKVTGVSDRWEGERRPGHFDGVATIVLKLFNIVRPTAAVFGLKDLQQCAVVRALVHSLNVPVSIVTMETARDHDGLALSSRNALLTVRERAIAPQLYKSLQEASYRIGACRANVAESLSQCTATLTGSGFSVEYVALVDPVTMEAKSSAAPDSRIIAAARLGSVRLIDNSAVPFP